MTRGACLVVLLAGLVGEQVLAQNRDLSAGGTSSWTVVCTGFLCSLGGSAATDNLTIKNGNKTGSFTFTNLDLKTNNFGGGRTLNINSQPNTGKITINTLRTSHTGAIGFTGQVSINSNTHIKSIIHQNRGGGTRLNIDIGKGNNNTYNKDLTLDQVKFNENGLSGSQGRISINANNMTLKRISGRLSQSLKFNASGKIDLDSANFDGAAGIGGFAVIPKSEMSFTAKKDFTAKSLTGMGHSVLSVSAQNITIDKMNFTIDICVTSACAGQINLTAKENIVIKSLAGGTANEGGIGAFNRVAASGKNFYAGKVEAMSLVTGGNNGFLDLSKVTGTTFIDDFHIRNSTLNAKNFHINNFSVRKANANRVGSEHPIPATGALRTAYTAVEYNIGKSFINYLSMEIGTSHTADNAALWFRKGGDILNLNLVDARATSYINASSIDKVNINVLNATQTSIYLKDATINTIVSKKGQTLIGTNSKIAVNSLNLNNLLHLKDGSKHSGALHIELNRNGSNPKNDFSKYVSVGVDSKKLTTMSGDEIQEVIKKLKTTADSKNASGIYLTTSDGKHYLLLPKPMTHNGFTNVTTATNDGNILIEQKNLTKGAFNNYGLVLLDPGFVTGDKPLLTVRGNVNNYNTIDIGANAKMEVTGNLNNYGKLIFRIQANPKSITDKDVKSGLLNIKNGSTSFDISPGSSGAFQADIADAKSLANLKLADTSKTADKDPNTYKLITITGGNIKYSYTYKDYTTVFDKNKITTTKNNGGKCTNNDCVDKSNNGHKQETAFTTAGFQNPWDRDKALVDTSGARVENAVGENDNQGNLIQKPSQSDKKCAASGSKGYCGFGQANIQENTGKSAEEKERDRGYNYAQERMKASFGLTYKGASIDSKYLQVERVVTDNLVGFRILKRGVGDFSGKAETPLCQAGSSSFDCALYMEAGGNNSWIKAIKEGSANGYEILKDLFYDENSSLLFLVNLDQTLASSRNLAYFLEVARTLDSSFQHVSNLRNKGAALQSLSLSMESARVSRLTKVAINQHGHHGINQANQTKLAMDKKKKELAVQVAQRLKRDNERRMEARGQ